MNNKDGIIKNRNNILKAVAGLTTCGMLFYAGHAGCTQIKLNQILEQKENLLSKYEEKAPNETMEYFRNFGTKQDLETYKSLTDQEKASKTTLKTDLSTAGAMFIALSLTGYGALLNNEIDEIDKKLADAKKSKDKEKEM